MTPVSDRFLSRGHGERFDATVWARAADGGAGEGAMYVEDLTARDGGVAAAGLLVMEKRGGVWRFLAVGPDGEVVDDAGAESCDPCHREAKDQVFAWPAPRP
jgi:hypothetical protein